MPWQAILAIACICVGYSLSDLGIQLQVNVLEKLPGLGDRPIMNSVFILSLVYLIMGVISPLFIPFAKRKKKGIAIDSIPYSLAWLAGMACLFASFACSNVVLGNMLQASRSIMAIFLGMLFVLMGFENVEKKISREVFLRRLLGAVSMMFAITLYLYGGEMG